MKSDIFRFAFVATFLLVTLPAAAQQSGNGVGTNYETRLSTLEDEMRTLNGRVEQVEYAAKRLDLAMQRMQNDYDARLTKLETAPPPAPPVVAVAPQPAPDTTQQAAAPVPDANGSLGAVKVQNGKVVGGVNSPKAPPLPDTPADYGLTTQEQYDRAFDLLRKADYAEAEKSFKSFIDKNPKDKLIGNAKYWYGETLYVQNKYTESAATFADAYQQDPKGPKAPDSLLKLALSLSGLNKIADACTTLSELKNNYPHATANVRSRTDEERTKLKCGAQ